MERNDVPSVWAAVTRATAQPCNPPLPLRFASEDDGYAEPTLCGHHDALEIHALAFIRQKAPDLVGLLPRGVDDGDHSLNNLLVHRLPGG